VRIQQSSVFNSLKIKIIFNKVVRIISFVSVLFQAFPKPACIFYMKSIPAAIHKIQVLLKFLILSANNRT